MATPVRERPQSPASSRAECDRRHRRRTAAPRPRPPDLRPLLPPPDDWIPGMWDVVQGLVPPVEDPGAYERQWFRLFESEQSLAVEDGMCGADLALAVAHDPRAATTTPPPALPPMDEDGSARLERDVRHAAETTVTVPTEARVVEWVHRWLRLVRQTGRGTNDAAVTGAAASVHPLGALLGRISVVAFCAICERWLLEGSGVDVVAVPLPVLVVRDAERVAAFVATDVAQVPENTQQNQAMQLGTDVLLPRGLRRGQVRYPVRAGWSGVDCMAAEYGEAAAATLERVTGAPWQECLADSRHPMYEVWNLVILDRYFRERHGLPFLATCVVWAHELWSLKSLEAVLRRHHARVVRAVRRPRLVRVVNQWHVLRVPVEPAVRGARPASARADQPLQLVPTASVFEAVALWIHVMRDDFDFETADGMHIDEAVHGLLDDEATRAAFGPLAS